MSGTVNILGPDGEHTDASILQLRNASAVLTSMLEGQDADKDSEEVIDMSDATNKQIVSFVALCSLASHDAADGINFRVFATQLRQQYDAVANALPLIHKYDCKGLKDLCWYTIVANPSMPCIVAYDQCFDDGEWSKDILKFIVDNTMGYEGGEAGDAATDCATLKQLHPKTLATAMAYISETTVAYSGSSKQFEFGLRKGATQVRKSS